MQSKFIITDGQKAANLLDSDDPSVWTYFSNAPMRDSDKLYACVAAAYRAYNLKANTVGNMPFVLMKGKTEFDNSATWENKVGFLPNPSDLLRLDTLSYMATNTIYNLRTSDALGYKVKGLYHAVPYSFRPYTNGQGTNVDYIERTVGSITERYQFPLDKRLVRMWRLDQTTELLPSPNTEALAIMNAAGVIYHADTWIKHFFERGGVPPTVIAMKGAINRGKRDEEERSWSNWLLGLGTRFRSRIARVFNADNLDVKQFGSSVTELKDNEVYSQSLANIAMGFGMPLSLLMANSANYATAKEEKATWYENDIIPLCNWIAYEYNRQVFEPIGLRLEFHPETLDPQQEDETERAAAINAFMDFLGKCPTYEVFIGACETFGYELSDSLVTAAEAYYQEKDEKEEEMREQMGQAGVVVGPDGKPLPAPKDEEQEDEEEQEEKKPFPPKKAVDIPAPAKWIPSIDELEELRIWREVMLRRFKKSQSLDYEYKPKAVPLPDGLVKDIREALLSAKSDEQIHAAFDIREAVVEAKAETPNDIMVLAAAINNLAARDVITQPQTKAEKRDDMQITINNPASVDMTSRETIEAVKAMTEHFAELKKAIAAPPPSVAPVIHNVVNVPEQAAPVVNVTNEVNPTPVEVKNEVTVRPAPVNVIEKGKRVATVKRDRDGKIQEITADEA
jgi:hypothetical protein